MTPAQKLREVLIAPALEVVPGCFDALSAKLVADAGFKATFMSGFAVSAARLGLPDTGLISFAEMLDSLRNCASGAARIPLIGDGDTGYGNALNVQRTVVEYARAGAAAVMIEDQVSPKKCGHTRGKQVIARDEARMKIRAAVEARADATSRRRAWTSSSWRPPRARTRCGASVPPCASRAWRTWCRAEKPRSCC